MRDAIQAVAVSWSGRRLYCYIIRGSIANFEYEVLFSLSALGPDIKIDSLRVVLYFSRVYSVEFYLLNCKDKEKMEFYRMEVYLGKRVMGCTFDYDSNRC